MSRPESHDDFRDLFHEAVDHVEPSPGLDAIRARTEQQETAMNRRWIAPLAGAAAVAAVIFGFVAVQGDDPSTKPDTPPATSPTGPTGTASPSPSPSPSGEPSGETKAVPVYFVGETPHGPRLYREFHRVTNDNAALGAAVLATASSPLDDDYDTAWPAGTTVKAVHFDGVGADGEITVDLSGDVHDAPPGSSARMNQLAIEQMIYSVQGVVGARAPVRFTLDGGITDTVLGVPTNEPLANGNPVETLSLVNISSPAEGSDITGDRMTVTGVANSFEATVPLRLLQGDKVVWEGFVTAEGCCEEKLFPFSTTVDVSNLAPGTYVLEAKTDDPSAGEGPGPFVDTKAIEIR